MTPARKNKPAIIIVGLKPNILVVYDGKNVATRPARYRYELKSCNPNLFDLKTRSLLLYDVNMNCIKSMNEAHKSIRREPNNIDNTHIKTTS